MSTLSYVDKERMANFFGFKGGYVFSFLKNGYNKTNTRNLIFDATGIDIYTNPEYDMSQERCIRKIKTPLKSEPPSSDSMVFLL